MLKLKCKLLSHVRLCNAMNYTVQGILQASILEWVAFPDSRGYPNPGIKPRSPALQVDSLPAETQWKPKNTRVGSLALLQRIIPTQELNQGLLHSRQILYQLRYQGSPKDKERTKQLPLKDGLKIQHSFLQWRKQADRENSGGNPPDSEGCAQMEHSCICQV